MSLSKTELVMVRDVSRGYPWGGGRVDVLKNISLSISSGEAVAVVGPSGCGKSTLLNIVGLLDKPDYGEVLFNTDSSQPVSITSQTSEVQLTALRRSLVGFVFQHFHLLSSLTVLNNAAMPGLLNGFPDAYERARALLVRVGLESRLDFFPTQLSGGEMQRCAIARALVHDPKLILADEPTGSLDSSSGLVVLELLREVCEGSGAALLIATHSVEAARRASRVIELPALSKSSPNGPS